MKKKRIKTIRLNKTVISKIGLQSLGGKEANTNQYKCTDSEYLCGPRETELGDYCDHTYETFCHTCQPECMTSVCSIAGC